MIKIDQILNTIGQLLTRYILFVFLIFSLSAESAETVVLGITGVALKENVSAIKHWGKHIEEKSGLKVELKFARSYDEIKSMVDTGSVDIAYVCGATYVDFHANRSAEILAVPLFHGRAEYHSLIIVRNQSSIRSLNDLKEKVFAFSDPNSNSGTIAPVFEFRKKGIDPKHYFKRRIFTYDHGESIVAVLEGFADAAAVDEMVFESFEQRHPDQVKNLRVIERFGPYPIPPLVYRSGLNPKTVLRIRDAVLLMNYSDEGRALLRALAVDRFVTPINIDYSQIARMIRFVRKSEQ